MQECVALEELYLSHNGIDKMEGLSTLVNLRVLDVASNKLTEINGIDNLTRFENQSNKAMHYSSPFILYQFVTFLIILYIFGYQVGRSVA